MDNILRHLMVAVADINLLAFDAVMFAVRCGRCANGGKIRASLRLGQIHGASPFALNHVRQIFGLLFCIAIKAHRVNSILGEKRTQSQSHICALKNFSDCKA